MPNPPWNQPYATSDQNGRSNGHGHYIGELRERVTGLERDVTHLDQRLTETTERITDGEQQKGRLAHRVGNLEMINSGRSSLDLRLGEIPDRMTTAEADIRYIRERLKWILFALLAIVGGMGWLPADVKKSIFHGILPPGIG
jgi:hypothetical protein